ncbi:MAG: hypothetical protein RMY28_013650 [Nostoc sp. ChiSLP01]|nr:hypothetical protein [Nostoc sp. CmiSLP01]MDZ8284593.1 hypothetical protein [Nostoc sp. ChiSLP01]
MDITPPPATPQFTKLQSDVVKNTENNTIDEPIQHHNQQNAHLLNTSTIEPESRDSLRSQRRQHNVLVERLLVGGSNTTNSLC